MKFSLRESLVLERVAPPCLGKKTTKSTNCSRYWAVEARWDSHHMDSLRQEKVQKFEEFVDKRLKPDLLHAITQRDKVFEQQKIFADLRRNIENLEKNSVTSLRTLVNLGSEVYLQAEVPDTQHIFVDIGFGFHVEFTWSEALNYIEKREEKIAR
ncbi:UXT-like protein [Spatholobus suberectus]|nr:UXT-like protein [Spatholobus suberectus]